MNTKFYIYDEKGNPSAVPFYAEEIINMGLPPDTIVCPEMGKPGKLSDFTALTKWTPPSIERERNRIPFIKKNVKYIAIASAIAISSGGGAYYVYEKESLKALEETQCIEYKRKLEIRIDSLTYEIGENNKYIEENNSEIVSINDQISELKRDAINFRNSIPPLKEKKIQLENDRNRAANEWCILQPCIDRRANTVANYNRAISTIDNEISYYTGKTDEIEQITIPDMEKKLINKQENIDYYKGKINEMELLINQIKKELEIPCDGNQK